MKHVKSWSLVLAGLLGLFATVTPAYAQLHLVAQQAVLSETTLTPPDTTVLATTESGEILALDVPPLPSSGYVQFTSSTIWTLDFSGDTPTRANFQLVFNLTSAALPPGVSLKFGVPLTFFGNPNGAGSFAGGTGVDSEVFTRKLMADILVAGNPSLSQVSAKQIANLIFVQGFHVSVSARLRSLNVTDGTVTNPNVAFFAEPHSVNN